MTQERNIPQEVKERLNIVDVISRYVKLRKAGKNYSGLCPFHNEKTPSFMVSEDIQRYKCFGCDRSGDIFNFIQEIETLEFPEALKKLAEEAGVEYTQSYKGGANSQLIKINEEAMSFFKSQLNRNSTARKYLEERGFTKTSINEFNIGFAPGYNSLFKFLSNRHQREQLKNSGLFTEKNGSLKDKFINRIMFPIWSTQGKVVGFSGRNLPGDDYGPKYLNTPETPIFRKGNLLFGLFQSKSSIKKEDLCILTEGQIDVISVFSKGHQNIVAPLGTGLTHDQLNLIDRYTNRLLYIFDSDEAGQKALERAFIEGSKLGFTMFANNPHPYKDLDDAAQKDPKKLKQLLNPKQEAYSYLLSNKLEEVDLTSLDGIRTLKKFHNYLTSEVKDSEGKGYYNRKFSELTGNTADSEGSLRRQANTQKTKRSPLFNNKQEAYFMSLVLQESMIDKLEKVDERFFSDKRISDLISFLKSGDSLSLTEITSRLDDQDPLYISIDNLVFNQSLYPKSETPSKTLNELYLQIQREHYRNDVDLVRKKLAIAEERDDNDQARELSTRIGDLTSKISTLNERISKL